MFLTKRHGAEVVKAGTHDAVIQQEVRDILRVLGRLYSKIIILNTKFIMFNAKFINLNANRYLAIVVAIHRRGKVPA